MLLSLSLGLMASVASAADEDAAKALAKSNNCSKCHALDKAKDGPSLKEIAKKNKDKPDAEKKLIDHLTSSTKVKFPDGHEEEHKVIKAKDADQVRNLVQYILSL
jgi:cytochrome c